MNNLYGKGLVILAFSKQYFLGANSRFGFHSLYNSFCKAEDGGFLYVIKGGPGCGKSSFMKAIGSAAEDEGYECEYILCSGDPDSLDGLFIPELGVGYVDGTAPHTIDAAYPGCGGMYLDLGQYYHASALRQRLDEIMQLNKLYKGLYSCAYASIGAATAAMPRYIQSLWGEDELQKLEKKLQGLINREFGKRSFQSDVKERFIDAVTSKGYIFLHDSISHSYERLITLDNKFGLGHHFLQRLYEEALGRTSEIILCRDCLDPRLITAIMFPEISLALICSLDGREELSQCRHMRLDSLIPREKLSPMRRQLRAGQHLWEDSLALATTTLADAKAMHDKIEAIYNPHVDFDGVYREAKRHIELLFS